MQRHSVTPVLLVALVAVAPPAFAQIGRRFPTEKKIVVDPLTGVRLSFLTTTAGGDSKIYPTHPQWTADGKWLIFRSRRVPNQALAVQEETGDIVQVTESGYTGMLCVARKSMRLILTRRAVDRASDGGRAGSATPEESDTRSEPPNGVEDARPREPESDSPRGGAPNRSRGSVEIVAIDLARVFADSQGHAMRPAATYEHVLGSIPADIGDAGDLALDATEDVAYFRINRKTAARHLPASTRIEGDFGPRHMGAGPTGIGSLDLTTGEVKVVVAVPFQIGHIQANPFVPGEIVFCWETGGKAPQRTWTVRSDGTGLRPLFPEAPFDWVTHEAVITKDEVAVAILGHRKPGTNDEWGPAGTREHPTGLGIVNLRTRELYVAGQTKSGSGLWHVHGSPDGRWAVGDDFDRNITLIDRHTNETILLSAGHKETAADHPHPTFSADSTRIEIQSAMLSADGRSMNICVIPVPDEWLARKYAEGSPEAP